MPVPAFSITCLSNEKIAHDIYECRFTKPADLSFKAGQFLLFDVPLLDDASDIQTRAYSVASTPREDDLLFIIKTFQGGRASEWFSKKVVKGTEVRIQGPFGVFTLGEGSRDTVMIATSTGVAPFRSQLVETLSASDARRFDLVFGVRSEEDLFWVEEFNTLSEMHDNFSFHPALTRPSSSWTGLTGRVQQVTEEVIPDLSARSIYACGNPEMTTDVKKKALGEWGVEKEYVHVEGYI